MRKRIVLLMGSGFRRRVAAVLFLYLFPTSSAFGAELPPAIQFSLKSKGFELSLGDNRLAYADGDPLFVLLYSDAADIWEARSWRMIGPDEEAVTERRHEWGYAIETFAGLPVRLNARADVNKVFGEITWDIRVDNRAPGTVVGVIGPCLRNVQDRPEGFLAIPNRPGQRIDDPWNTLVAGVQHLAYPVPASMQYMAYSGRGGGVAVHVFDRDMAWKQLAFGGKGRQMTFIQYPFVAPGGAWRSPEVLWQALTTDWHAAADRYRAWFRRWPRDPRVSPAIQAMPIVPGIVIRSRPEDDAYLKDVRKSMEKGTYKAAYPQVEEYARSGMSGVHLIGWFGQGHDTTYPDHLPSESMGGEDGLLDLAAKIHGEGMMAVYYLNARLLNVTNPTYRAHPEWAAIAETGEPRREVISTETFHVACPGSAGYRDHLKQETWRVATRYAGDGVQLDQIGAAWSILCFDRSHGHKTPATGWAPGYVEMLKDIYATVRAKKPKFFCWIEGAWEGAGQYVDLSQGGFWPDHPGAKPFPQMYRYTLPEHPLFGDASIGGVPYWCPTDLERAKRIDAQAAPFFWGGDFRDDLGLSVEPPGEAHWFVKKKSVLIAAHNPSGEDRTFKAVLDVAGLPPRSALARWRAEGAPQTWQAQALAAGTDLPVDLSPQQLTVAIPIPAGQTEAVLLTPLDK